MNADDPAASDLLPSTGLVTSSEEYYPTVAINALMRVLRDPSMGSQHMAVTGALMQVRRGEEGLWGGGVGWVGEGKLWLMFILWWGSRRSCE